MFLVILMGFEERDYNFISKVVKESHDRNGMEFFKELSDRYEDESWERVYLEGIYNYLLEKRSGASTRFFGINEWVIKDILTNVPFE